MKESFSSKDRKEYSFKDSVKKYPFPAKTEYINVVFEKVDMSERTTGLTTSFSASEISFLYKTLNFK